MFSRGFREVFARFSLQKYFFTNFCVPLGPRAAGAGPSGTQNVFEAKTARKPRENLAKTWRKPRENFWKRHIVLLGNDAS